MVKELSFHNFGEEGMEDLLQNEGTLIYKYTKGLKQLSEKEQEVWANALRVKCPGEIVLDFLNGEQ